MTAYQAPMRALALLAKLEKAVSVIGLWLAVIAAIASLVMVVVGVVGRYVLHVGVVFVDEYAGYALVVMAFMGLAHTLTAGKHIRIDVVVTLLPEKARAWLDVCTAIVAFGTCILVGVQGWQRAMTSYTVGTVSVSPIETPLFIPQLFIPLGLAFLSVSLLLYVARATCAALTGRGANGGDA